MLSPQEHVRLRRRVLAACVMVGCLVMVAACGAAAPHPAPSPVLSNYERSTGSTIHRDCGYSSPLPGKPGWSIWLFCDTTVTGAHGRKVEGLILGTGTAADGPYQAGRAPAWLNEIATPPAPPASPSTAAPQPFLPAPRNLQLPGSMLPCAGPGAYPAAWISGVTRTPSAAAAGTLLITYDDYCVTGTGETLTAEGFGLAEYDPASNLLGPVTPVFSSGLGLPSAQVLGSPVTGGDGYLYLFGFCRAAPAPAGCGRGQVYVARTVAAPAYWRNPFTYQYWTGDGWSAQAAAALADTGWPAARHLGRRLRSRRPGTGDDRADEPGGRLPGLAGQLAAGPWRRLLAGRVPCTRGSEPGAEGLCRALIGHPELSTRSRLLISYYDPGNYHVYMSAYPW